MSVVQVRQIKGFLESTFKGLIDLSDYAGKSATETERAFLSRSVAGLALMRAAGLTASNAAHAVVDGFEDTRSIAVYGAVEMGYSRNGQHRQRRGAEVCAGCM